jgi:hypothetical protein
MKIKSKIIIGLALIVLIMLIGLIAFPRTYTFLKFNRKYSIDKQPYLYSTAVYRNIPASNTDVVGNEISYDGLTLLSPWGKALETKEIGSNTVFTFEDDRTIILYKKLEESLVDSFKNGTVNEMVDKIDIKQYKEKANIIEQLYGKDTLSSDFMFIKAILDVTPSNVKLLMPKKEFVKNYTMITLKEIMFPFAEVGKVYYFENNYLKGFQFGSSKGMTTIWIYDKNHSLYQIVVIGNEINQEVIDSLISTINFTYKQ